jgi:DNA-binding response OmpR family regulator
MNNRVLIVDDNIDLNDGLAVILKEENYKVSSAYNGHDAIELFKTDEYDCVFLDIQLPDMSGFDVFRELHRLRPHTRIIVMTGYRIDQMIKKITNTNNVSVLCSPFDMQDLVNNLTKNKTEITIIFSDKNDFSRQIKQYLEDQGKTTRILSSTDEANKNSLHICDVLILRMARPILSSIITYMDLKEKKCTAPTIIVVDHPDNIDSRAAMNSALVTDCLFKPFHPRDAIEAIKKAA